MTLCPPLGPVAWFLGNRALQDMADHPDVTAHRRRIQAGRICGIVSSCVLAAAVSLTLLMFVGAPYSVDP